MKKIVFISLIFLSLLNCTSYKVNNLYKKANRLIEQEKYKEAEDILNEILMLDNNYANAYISRAVIKHINNELDLAMADLLTAVDLDKKNYIAHFNLGNIYFMKGSFEDAVNQYSIAILCNSSFTGSYLNRANAYMKLELYEEALKDYKYYVTTSDNQKENIAKLIKILEDDLNK